MGKTLITDTLDRHVRTTNFKDTLKRDAEAAKVAQAEQDRLDRIAKDEADQEDWRRGRKDSIELVDKAKNEMTKAADDGKTHLNFPVATGEGRMTETAYDRGLLDGLATWLRYESFKFEVSRASFAADDTGPGSYNVSVNVSW